MSKIKTYVLMLSEVFPTKHPKAGKRTYFKPLIQNAISTYIDGYPGFGIKMKLHTIRENYKLWENRINKVREGKAIISLRQWSGLPFRSKQIEFMQITHRNNPGIQHISMLKPNPEEIYYQIDNKPYGKSLQTIANNDGLEVEDFRRWFFPNVNKTDIYFEGAIIHFTEFRY